MKKVIKALKDSWEFLCEPVVFRTRWWHFISTLFSTMLGYSIAEAFWYYYG